MVTRTGPRAGALVVVTVGALALTSVAIGRHIYPLAWGFVAASQVPSVATRTYERTPARLKRGKYLADNVVTCFRCHSERDWNSPGAPPVSGKKGAGYFFSVGAGPVDVIKPPTVYAANITPDSETGVGRWSDEMLARAIRESVNGDGRPFPSKFHVSGRNLSDEDLASVVAYLRTIPAVHNAAPKTTTSSAQHTEAATQGPVISVPEPAKGDPVRRGAYLASIADCASCHTADAANAPLLDKKLGGGKLMSDNPDHYVVSPNITMDPSGIGYYDEKMFVRVLRTGKVSARKLYPIMPWGYFRNMTNEDLKALFAFLKAQPRVQHIVDNTEPPTYCRRCLQRHGAGDRN